MSLESWKKEFYPIDAIRPLWTEEAAIKHSLMKWKGLQERALRKHKVLPTYGGGVTTENDQVPSGSLSCALCQFTSMNCAACPLNKVSPGACTTNSDSLWIQYVRGHDPMPMIWALRKTLWFYKIKKLWRKLKWK